MSLTRSRESSTASGEVVQRVAEREGVDPADLDTPLFEVVDPEALDALAQASTRERIGAPVRIEFTYVGYDLVVTSDGSVRVAGES